jgi:hypothetical protein
VAARQAQAEPAPAVVAGTGQTRLRPVVNHLNAEEDHDRPDYPKDPAFKAKFGPHGVL